MLDCVILAAGEGTRMKSDMSKVLHKVAGSPILEWVIEAAEGVIDGGKVTVVVGKSKEQIEEIFSARVTFAHQKERLGTGHALMQALPFLRAKTTLVLSGDSPLITTKTLQKAFLKHISSESAVTVLTARIDEPRGYGRILRNSENDDEVQKIVEEKDATAKEKLINEVNSGIYFLDTAFVKSLKNKLKSDNSQGEFYLTDCIEIALAAGKKISAIEIADANEMLGINDRMQLSQASELLKTRINSGHMRNGVTIMDSNSTYISKHTKIGKDTIIYPNTHIEGKTTIGDNCTIIGGRIADSHIKNGVTIENSVVLQSTVGKQSTIGPFAYIRPNSIIGKNNRIGDFVEIKNSKTGNGTKVSHLTYIGDSDVGERVNFGCGSVIVNYDGKKKHRSTVGDDAFIGCNVNLISPVNVGKNSFIAAGTNVTHDVPEKALAIGRSRQEIKSNWKNNE